MKKQAFFLVALLFGTLAAHADPIADLANEKCVKCHNPSATYSHIDGQNADYLYKASLAYKNKSRSDVLMYKRVVNLDDATLKALAEYFSKLAPEAGVAGDPALMATGKDLYENGIPAAGVQSCADCHGKNAEGGGFGSALNPRMAGQLSGFTITQMMSYRDGTIKGEPEMTAIAKKLTDAQIKAIAVYVQSK